MGTILAKVEFHEVMRKAHPKFITTKALAATTNIANKPLSRMTVFVITPLCDSLHITASESETNRYEFRNLLQCHALLGRKDFLYCRTWVSVGSE